MFNQFSFHKFLYYDHSRQRFSIVLLVNNWRTKKVYTKNDSSSHRSEFKNSYKKNKVDSGLNRLLQLEILKPVDYSNWTSPIVPVIKKVGSVRICGEF